MFEREAGYRGFLVFRDQGKLSAATLLNVTRRFGGIASRHTVHPAAEHEDVFRLSNKAQHGVQGVGPLWHNDGSHERRVFSHILFNAVAMPDAGGETELVDLARALASVPTEIQRRWRTIVTVNAYSGSVHPLVHSHPLSARPVIFVHLGQTGAALEWTNESMAKRLSPEH
eukprot:1365714-Amphidinium_carterae.1